MSVPPKVLILTASFGDGHNSAARHLAEALEPHAQVRLADPCHLGNPRINRVLCRLYREITTYLPAVWAAIYHSTDRHDLSKPLPFISKTEEAVATLLRDFAPDIIVNTYPLYPYIVRRQEHHHPHHPAPIVTIVTDSIEINAAWSRSPSDHLLVTDTHTRESLTCQNLPTAEIHVTGFPVTPRFLSLPKLSADAPVTPFKVLFFPTARSPHVVDIIKAVLLSQTEITVVLGRNFRRLYRKVRDLQLKHPGRIRIKGWTRKVPELLSSHHLVIGKAGGATVHEALAAQCPMLVHHIVPGQEEGNIELLARFQVGSLATSAQKIDSSIKALLADNASLWRQQKTRMQTFTKPGAARDAAKLILSLT